MKKYHVNQIKLNVIPSPNSIKRSDLNQKFS